MSRGCFWELFDPEWSAFLRDGETAPTRPSYCHPWSSGVTAWLSAHHLGIRPTRPGFSLAAVTPHLSPSHPSVDGAVWASSGQLHVRAALSITQHAATYHIDSPVPFVVGAAASITLTAERAGSPREQPGQPDKTAIRSTLKLHGFAINGAIAIAPHENKLHGARAFGYTRELPAGRHVIVARYRPAVDGGGASRARALNATRSSSTAVPPGNVPGSAVLGPPSYSATWSLDRLTRGDWVGRYGSDGYVLFGAQANLSLMERAAWVAAAPLERARQYWVHGATGPADQQRLPRGGPLHDVATPKSQGGRPKREWLRGWGSGHGPAAASHDWPHVRTLLQDPLAPARLRTLGRATNQGQGLVIDVDLAPGVAVVLSVYLVTEVGGALVIRIMDLHSLAPIAKSAVVKDAAHGVYLRLRCAGGVRLRLMNMHGDTLPAAASAVFVDRKLQEEPL